MLPVARLRRRGRSVAAIRFSTRAGAGLAPIGQIDSRPSIRRRSGPTKANRRQSFAEARAAPIRARQRWRRSAGECNGVGGGLGGRDRQELVLAHARMIGDLATLRRSHPQADRAVDRLLDRSKNRERMPLQHGRFADRRLGRGEHDLARDGNGHRLLAQVARDGERAPVQHDPPLVLVEVDASCGPATGRPGPARRGAGRSGRGTARGVGRARRCRPRPTSAWTA